MTRLNINAIRILLNEFQDKLCELLGTREIDENILLVEYVNRWLLFSCGETKIIVSDRLFSRWIENLRLSVDDIKAIFMQSIKQVHNSSKYQLFHVFCIHNLGKCMLHLMHIECYFFAKFLHNNSCAFSCSHWFCYCVCAIALK